MMPTLVDEPPDGGDWIHEVKYGYRTRIILENGTAHSPDCGSLPTTIGFFADC
jgi:hypothetical protein